MKHLKSAAQAAQENRDTLVFWAVVSLAFMGGLL